MQNDIKERDSGIDLFRIILAVMVILIHINAPATGNVCSNVDWMPMKFLVYGTMALIYPAVNCYVLISGFYSFRNNRGIRDVFRNLFKLWFCLLFFSLMGYMMACLSGYQAFSLKGLIARFFPLTTGEWWFMTNYFAMMLLSPAMNNILDRSDKRAFWGNIVVALTICSILPFFVKYQDVLGLLNGSGLIWFVVLYMTGRGIYKFYYKEKQGCKIRFTVSRSFCAYLALSISLVAFGMLFGKVPFLNGYTFSMYNSPIVYLQAVCLFCIFKAIKVCGRISLKIITALSGLSLASYIFHCQPDIEMILWKVLEPSKFANSIMLIPLACCIVLEVYFTAVVIEYIRKKLVSTGVEKKIIDTICNKLFNSSFIDKFLTNV